jgi:checkpoint serine/threonine-protein kinase
LLNPKTVRTDAALPVTEELAEIRGRFEEWLVENCQKGGKSLRAMLKKIELAAMTARRG